MYTTVFCVPITLRMTSILGNERAGPANSNAKAGPWPIPFLSKPSIMGTSVRVAKYMRAPKTEAKKFEKREFPPTRPETHWLGIRPSPSLVPSKRPEELDYLRGDASSIKDLGWEQEYVFETMIDEMINHWSKQQK